MDIKPLAPEISVTGQITPDDVATLAARGFRTLIGNRPDGEEASQPSFAAIAAAAREAGMEARHIPIDSGSVTEHAVHAFADAMRDLPKPVLAYCRSGARSSTLWSLQDALKAT